MSRMVLEVVLTFFARAQESPIPLPESIADKCTQAWVLVYASLAYMRLPYRTRHGM